MNEKYFDKHGEEIKEDMKLKHEDLSLIHI